MRARFNGFSPAMVNFFRDLESNNRREWFQPRKHIYLEKVRAPMEELVEKVNQELVRFAPDHINDPAKAIYRIYRDTRFSKDKTPYKTHIGAIFPRRGLGKHSGAGYYFSVAAEKIEVAGGVYMPGSGELLAVRAYLAEHHPEFRRLIRSKRLVSLMGELQGEQLRRAPKGFPQDHPALNWLRHKQWYFYTELEPAVALTPRLLPELMKRFQAMRAFIDFLNVPLLARRKQSQPAPVSFRL